MSIALLEEAAASLGPLVDEVAFLGGASLVLWMTDSAAPDPRVTLDVDVIVLSSTQDSTTTTSARGFAGKGSTKMPRAASSAGGATGPD
ncbi:MAG: hypothetical protein WCJ67_12580 [Thermoleophilia bacterium]